MTTSARRSPAFVCEPELKGDASRLFKCSQIMISADSVSRLRHGKPVETIPKEKIVNLKLCRDTGVRRPFRHFLIGFIMVMTGSIGEFLALVSSLGGRRPAAGVETGNMVIPLAPIVFWVVIGAGFLALAGVFRVKYYLLVETGQGISRLFFEERTGQKEICRFLSRAGTEFGYEFDLSENEKPPGDGRG